MSLWAIIPIKPIRRGKSRLSVVLSEKERTELNKWLLTRTINSVKNVNEISNFVVISYDPATLSIARDLGAKTIQENRFTNLNRALRRATSAVKVFNATKVIVLPADLPFINGNVIKRFIKAAGKPPEIIIAPDQRQNGTNALLINPIGIIDYDFGQWSFKKHIEQAERNKYRISICNIEGLNFDLDTPGDYEFLLSKGFSYKKMEDT